MDNNNNNNNNYYTNNNFSKVSYKKSQLGIVLFTIAIITGAIGVLFILMGYDVISICCISAGVVLYILSYIIQLIFDIRTNTECIRNLLGKK